jgi:hypothetical protein
MGRRRSGGRGKRVAIRKLWYERAAPASTAAAHRLSGAMCFHRVSLTPVLALALAAGAGAGCADTLAEGGAGGGGGTSHARAAPTAASAPPVAAGATNANLAGARCHGGTCTCRNRNASPAEQPPPAEGQKRFEIRLGADAGTAVLESPTLGRFTSSDAACFYVDVAPGTTHEVTFTAAESRSEGGVGPMLDIEEYGPKGPWWYRVVEVHCAGPGGRCNRDAADEWGADAKNRKRGRIDPCGSTVITHLAWGTSGGSGMRELGLFRDFIVKFTMEVKKFPTQFKPGSTECVPK